MYGALLLQVILVTSGRIIEHQRDTIGDGHDQQITFVPADLRDPHEKDPLYLNPSRSKNTHRS